MIKDIQSLLIEIENQFPVIAWLRVYTDNMVITFEAIESGEMFLLECDDNLNEVRYTLSDIVNQF